METAPAHAVWGLYSLPGYHGFLQFSFRSKAGLLSGTHHWPRFGSWDPSYLPCLISGHVSGLSPAGIIWLQLVARSSVSGPTCGIPDHLLVQLIGESGPHYGRDWCRLWSACSIEFGKPRGRYVPLCSFASFVGLPGFALRSHCSAASASGNSLSPTSCSGANVLLVTDHRKTVGPLLD
jgi:hypothetical protein